MTPLILAILAVVAVGAAGLALVPSMLGNSRADKRISALKGDIQANRREANATRDRDQRRKDIQQTLKTQTDLLEKRKRRIPLQDRIYQAGFKTKVSVFVRNQIIVGAVIFVVCFLLQVQLLFALVFGREWYVDATGLPPGSPVPARSAGTLAGDVFAGL